MSECVCECVSVSVCVCVCVCFERRRGWMCVGVCAQASQLNAVLILFECQSGKTRFWGYS